MLLLAANNFEYHWMKISIKIHPKDIDDNCQEYQVVKESDKISVYDCFTIWNLKLVCFDLRPIKFLMKIYTIKRKKVWLKVKENE